MTIPLAKEFSQIVDKNSPGGHSSETLQKLYSDTLLNPLEEFLSRPKKSFRRELIQLGYLLAAEAFNLEHQKDQITELILEKFESVIELIHSGSLIVDDIQDQSLFRRGKETLHRIHGVPLALNAGNWLYFWPFHIIHQLDLQENIRNRILLGCHETLLLAHSGQALDIGTQLKELPPKDISAVVLKTMELKSGALTALAIDLGVYACLNSQRKEFLEEKKTENAIQVIHEFGVKFGQLLQICDDMGNLSSASNLEKRFEDIRLLRPSFVWLILSEELATEEFNKLLKDLSSEYCPLKTEFLLKKTNLKMKAQERALELKNKWTQDFFEKLPLSSTKLKSKIITSLEGLYHAY